MAFGPNRSATMSSGLLLDSIPSSSTEQPSVGPRFRPYSSPNHHVTKGRYITSNDPRGYIPVYEYPLNGQWIMLDMDDGYVLWTGIWKALGNNKADIVKIIDSQPDLASQLRRVRGGYLKIQGTWMPYEIALRLARRVAWPIRHDLVPLFGPTFPNLCLSPDQPEYGQIVSPGTGKRRARRSVNSDFPADPRNGWTVISPSGPHGGVMDHSVGHSVVTTHTFHQQAIYSNSISANHGTAAQTDSPVMLHVPYIERPHHQYNSTTAPNPYRQDASHRRTPPSDGGGSMRYSPYPPSPVSARPAATVDSARQPLESASITLPSIQAQSQNSVRSDAITLPPISAMDTPPAGGRADSIAVLRRLQSDDTAGPSTGGRPLLHRRSVASEHAPTVPDAYRADSRHGSRRASCSTSSSTTTSPALPAPSVSTAAVSSAKASAAPPLPPVWGRQAVPSPLSPHGNAARHDRSDYPRSTEGPYCAAAPGNHSSDPERRTWRPW